MYVWTNIKKNKEKKEQNKWIMNTEIWWFFSRFYFLLFSLPLFQCRCHFCELMLFKLNRVAFNHVSFCCHIFLLIWKCGLYKLCASKEWRSYYRIFQFVWNYFRTTVWLLLVRELKLALLGEMFDCSFHRLYRAVNNLNKCSTYGFWLFVIIWGWTKCAIVERWPFSVHFDNNLYPQT